MTRCPNYPVRVTYTPTSIRDIRLRRLVERVAQRLGYSKPYAPDQAESIAQCTAHIYVLENKFAERKQRGVNVLN